VQVGERVRGALDEDELDRDHVGALMQHLEVRVLPVGARLAPHHRAAGVRQVDAVEVDTLAVALHLELLQVGRQALRPW
jgi:hypothetical protein